MISKNELKYIQSFAHKKQWAQESVFIVEGPKLLAEIMESNWEVEKIFALEEWASKQSAPMNNVTIVDELQLERISQLQQSNQVLALVRKKIYATPLQFEGNFTIVLDGIQDPGNLGTIIRTADWFGCNQIIVTEDTANMYNPKVLQSTMGSFLRVRVDTMDIEQVLKSTSLPIYGAVLDGNSIYTSKISKEGFLVIGNESKGIRSLIYPLISSAISIPGFGKAESLNAAVATGIILSHWRSN